MIHLHQAWTKGGGGVAVDTLSEKLTITSASERGHSPSKGKKKSTNHTPTPIIQ